MFLVVSAMMGFMTGELEKLGAQITRRRVDRGFRQRAAFAKHIQLSDRSLADIEKGVRPAGVSTYALIEQGLLWRPGSIQAILEGRSPMPEEDPPSLTTVPIDDLLSEIRRRVVDHGSVGDDAQPLSHGRPQWTRPFAPAPQVLKDTPHQA